MEILIENNQCYTTWEITDILKISKSSMEDHLHQLDYVHCFEVWVPHKLTKQKKKKKKETFLIIFLRVILYLNVMKMFHF